MSEKHLDQSVENMDLQPQTQQETTDKMPAFPVSERTKAIPS